MFIQDLNLLENFSEAITLETLFNMEVKEMYEFKRDEYGVILEEEFVKAIEEADNIDEVAVLRDILESDDVYGCLNCSTLLSVKESDYGL